MPKGADFGNGSTTAHPYLWATSCGERLLMVALGLTARVRVEGIEAGPVRPTVAVREDQPGVSAALIGLDDWPSSRTGVPRTASPGVTGAPSGGDLAYPPEGGPS
jgi:hypothetical protein